MTTRAEHDQLGPAAESALVIAASDRGFEIVDLEVAYRHGTHLVPVVGGASLSARPGRITGVAGESGSGKTTAVLAGIGYAPPGALRLRGDARLDGVSLFELSRDELRRVWATRVSYVAQDAARALNPAFRVGTQIAEVLRVHLGLSAAAARTRSTELIEAVRLPEPEKVLRRYPHEFSGGQLQRIAIAMAIACEPEVVILDEPTTGLDVTTQSEVIGMLGDLIRQRDIAALYISHDLALLGAISDDLAIFYAGELVEAGPTRDVLAGPRHPYTRALLDALPSVHRAVRPRGIAGLPPGRVVGDVCSFAARCLYARDACAAGHPSLQPVGPSAASQDRLVRCVRTAELGPLTAQAAQVIDRGAHEREPYVMRVADLVCSYGHGAHRVVALAGVSLDVGEGEVVALVGESGSGKTTVGRAIAGIVSPQSGAMTLLGEQLALTGQRTRQQRRDIQIIFQNPDSSLNPRHTVGQLVRRPIELFREDVRSADRGSMVADALLEVQLDPSMAARYPHQLSGGQRQRVAIAMAFVARPKLVICDEIVSGQDVSVQAAILELVREIQTSHGTAVLFISHDLAVVRSIAQYVYVIHGGRIQEQGPTHQIFASPQHAYTQQLLGAVLEPESTPPSAEEVRSRRLDTGRAAVNTGG